MPCHHQSIRVPRPLLPPPLPLATRMGLLLIRPFPNVLKNLPPPLGVQQHLALFLRRRLRRLPPLRRLRLCLPWPHVLLPWGEVREEPFVPNIAICILSWVSHPHPTTIKGILQRQHHRPKMFVAWPTNQCPLRIKTTTTTTTTSTTKRDTMVDPLKRIPKKDRVPMVLRTH